MYRAARRMRSVHPCRDGEMRKVPFERANVRRKSGWCGVVTALVYATCPSAVVVRSYLGYYAGSHQNSAAKRPWARIVLPWVTRWEVLVSYPFCASAHGFSTPGAFSFVLGTRTTRKRQNELRFCDSAILRFWDSGILGSWDFAPVSGNMTS